MTSIQQTHPNLQSLTELSEEQLATYRDDEAFAASVDALIRQNAAQAAANDATMRNTASGGARGSTPKGLLEQKNNNTAGGNQRPYKMMALRCSRYPGAGPAKLRTAASSAFAQKVREMSGTERDSAFDALCKELAVPEAREDRLEFFYAVIAWITLNTASTENGIDSVIGGKYSSTQMLEFFNHDLRPFARALANDAKDFISFVTSERSHELYEPFNNLARKYEVPKTPWLIYDGIDAAKITGGEAKIADLIKQSRLNNNVDYNASAAINRQVLKGNNYSGRPNN